MKKDKGIYFTTIIPGKVELKRGNRTYQNYKNHMHDELSIGMIIEGSTSVVFPQETIEFVKGDGIIIPPTLSHRCTPNDIDTWCFDMLYIHPSFYSEAMSFEAVAKVNDPSGIQAFLNLLELQVEQDYIEEQLIELLESLYKQQFDDSQEAGVSKTRLSQEEMGVSEDQELLIGEQLRTYIAQHYLEKMTLDELAKEFHIKKFAMIRNFRKQYNTTPLAYQLQLKMVQAKKLLMEQTPVLDVCYELGFYDQAHFTREFKKMNGLTPNAYRESILD